MSTSDESELTESNKKPTEILDDDVTLISISNPYGQLRSIMLRLLLAIIFLGVGVGAVVYSVYSSERNANAEDTNVTTVDYFNIRVNQICDKGLYIIETIVNVTSDGEVVKRDILLPPEIIDTGHNHRGIMDARRYPSTSLSQTWLVTRRLDIYRFRTSNVYRSLSKI
uniref:Integral membrane protein 2 n=1 Tax=Parascaris univalens TaxID=6257 RepID=A0A915AJD2_PARUN